MPHDPLPPADEDFHAFIGSITDYITTNATKMDVTPDQVADLTGATSTWNIAYPAHKTAAATATGAAATKANAREDAEGVLRPIIQQLQASPKVTDAQRSDMKIPIHKTSRTKSGVPTTVPMATADTSLRLQHLIQFRDATQTSSRAKPAGVKGCEIWSKVGGPAPTDPSQLTYLGTSTRSPYRVNYTGAQAGQMVWYWLRWVNAVGQPGPWSEPLSATIQG